MRMHGTLYEITSVTSFVQHYVTNGSQPSTDSIRPVPNASITLHRWDQAHSPSLAQSNTDDTGRFELDVSISPDASMFLSASGHDDVSERRVGSGQHLGCWYRSSPYVPGTVDGGWRNFYFARVAIPCEAGFSQAHLGTALDETKKEVADLEWIKGRIKPDGITLSCGGKGATASARLVLHPDRSGHLSKPLHHSVEDFRLELPGPSWLVGLVVSQDAIKASIRAGLAELTDEIGRRLRLSAISRFAHQLQLSDPAAVDRIVSETTLSFSRLQYEITPADGPSKAFYTIIGEACFGFPRTLEAANTQR